jgi:multiple sugar transport system substrate-binding protein
MSPRPLSPPSSSAGGLPALGRRTMLKGMFGVAAAAATPGVLAACGSSKSSGSKSKTVTLGSNYADPVPKKALADMLGAFEQQSGLKVSVNTVDHNTFQQQINSYLQGKPQDVFSWFSGYRMQFFAQKGLATPVNEVWDKIGGHYTDAIKAACKGLDGKYYIVPILYYPWAVFYRKSVWAQHGYQVPQTWDQLTALWAKMKSDGLIPITVGDKDGWPPMGTFDIINMRVNGYDFHINLMKGKTSWTDPKVKTVFDTWKQLAQYYPQGVTGMTWQESMAQLINKQAGMGVYGTDQVGPAFSQAGGDALADLDFFPFPSINAEHGQDSIDAPLDGFMASKKLKNKDGAFKLLEYIGTGDAQLTYLKSNPSDIAAAKDASSSGYSDLQKKSIQLIQSAKHLAQFMDRDTNPTFAQTVMIPALQKFLDNPSDIDGVTKQIEGQRKSVFAD